MALQRKYNVYFLPIIWILLVFLKQCATMTNDLNCLCSHARESKVGNRTWNITTSIECRRKCNETAIFHGIPRKTINNTNPIKDKMRVKERNHNYCHFEYLKFQKKNGIENPDVPLRIEYRIFRNKIIPKIMWKPPEECNKQQDLCKGYFIKWGVDFIKERIFCHNVSKDINEFILNETMGYTEKRNFAVTVKVIPFRKKNKLNLSYLTPLEQYGNVRSNKPIHPSTAIFTNVSSNETRKHNEKPDKNLPITIILSLSVVVFVIVSTVGLLGKWIHRRRTDNNDFKMPQKEDTMGKGKIYVSYLPEKGTINHVNDIYHFLKSNHIDVVMDQMYADQKLYHSLGPKRFGEKFLRQAGKVIMIVTQSYLRICRWDETVNIEAVPRFSSLNEERLFSEVSLIKSELSTTTKHQRIRFIPVLIKVSEDQLPKWLNLTEIVKWPDDRKTGKFVKNVIDEDLVNNASENKISSFF